MNEERLYFAYGSNINLDQMARRCPNATVLTPVTLDGYRLAFRASGVATILPEEGASVPGLLWKLTPHCERSLDTYEGFPRFYGKEDVYVRDGNGNHFPVMAYIMTPEYAQYPAEPLPQYCAGIREGYLQNGMPPAPFDQAVQRGRKEAPPRCDDPWQDFGEQLRQSRKPKHKNRDR